MSAEKIMMYLLKINDGLKKVESITRSIGTMPSHEYLEKAMSERNRIMHDEVDMQAKSLASEFPDWRVFSA
jgi:hypothetical protein